MKNNKAETKMRIVYGQPYINGRSLLQDQILMISMPNGSVNSSSNLVILIPDIWEDLKKQTGKFSVKQAKGNVWFWDDKDLVVTDTESEKNIKFRVQIPIPTVEVFRNSKGMLDLEYDRDDNEWTKYWKKYYEQRQ